MEENLKLGNQLCFPIYKLAKEIVAIYRPILDELDLTYPQYLVMLVLWEKEEMTVTNIGELLGLDNSTVTPILKRLEQKKYIERKRCKADERIVYASLAEEGKLLEAQAKLIPEKMFNSLPVQPEDLAELKTLINRILSNLNT